jgi:hypothetical protein
MTTPKIIRAAGIALLDAIEKQPVLRSLGEGEADGLGFQRRIGEPESNLMPGMAAPRPKAASQAGIMALAAPSITDTSIAGPVALQSPVPWTYDIDPATGVSRATFAGETVGASGATLVTSASIAGLYGRNRLRNAEPRIDIRNNHAGIAIPAVLTFYADGWQAGGTQANQFTAQSNLISTQAPGFNAIHYFTGTAGGTVIAAGDAFYFQHKIEGQDLNDFALGTANAQPFTLSFYATASIAGTYSGTVANASGTRGYGFQWTMPGGGPGAGWARYSITIPGDVTGTWAHDNTVGLWLYFDLGSGSNQRGPAGSWYANQYFGVTGSTSLVAAGGTPSYAITGIQIEAGTTATPFERTAIALETDRCNRYYRRFTGAAGNLQVQGYGAAGAPVYFPIPLSPPMRQTPTGTILGTWTFTNATAITLVENRNDIAFLSVAPTALGAFQASNPVNGGFDLYSEL